MPSAKDYPEHIDIELSRPIELGGVKVSSLRMREPTLADSLVAKKTGNDEATQEVQLFANLCGVPADDLHRLPVRDYSKLAEAYYRFTL